MCEFLMAAVVTGINTPSGDRIPLCVFDYHSANKKTYQYRNSLHVFCNFPFIFKDDKIKDYRLNESDYGAIFPSR